MRSLPDKPLYDLVALALLLALFFGVSMGDRPYSVPSESRYIEIGREMAESGDLVTPRLNYVKYFEKPPLFYWVQAASAKLLPINSFTARIPTALFTILICLLTYSLGRMLDGRLAGFLSTGVMATTLYVFALSRIVLLDVPVSAFIVATLTAFLCLARSPSPSQRPVIIYGMYIAAACAVMTKGLIGAVLPAAVVFFWMACTGRWNLLRELRLVRGILLFLLITVPWHVLVSLRNPEFPHFYFIHEHFERYLTTVHGRHEPFWFFSVVLVAGLCPWIAFMVQALIRSGRNFWQERKINPTPLFLFLWIGIIFIFFSLSDSQLIPYILPVFPPIAVLIGCYLTAAWRENPVPGLRTGLGIMMLLLMLLALTPTILWATLDPYNKILVALSQAGSEARYMSLAGMLGAGALLIVFIQGRIRHVILTLVIIAATVASIGDKVAAHYNKDSMAIFAGIIKELQEPGDEVATYGSYYQDLPVYLARRITAVDWKGELQFGTEHEDTSAWMINDEEFWKRWNKPGHRMFAVMREEHYIQLTKEKNTDALHLAMQRLLPDQKGLGLHLYPLRQDGRNLLFTNLPPKAPAKTGHKK